MRCSRRFIDARRRAVRHLHAGNDSGGGESAGAQSAAGSGADSRWRLPGIFAAARATRRFSSPCWQACSEAEPRRVRVVRSGVRIGNAARSCGNARRAWRREPGVWKPFAGGTDLMVLLEAGKLPHRKFLNIWNFAELRGIAATRGAVTLGALTTYTEMQRHAMLRARISAAVPRGCGDRRRGDAESRHAWRKYRERIARRGFAAGAARLRRGTRTYFRGRDAAESLTRVSYWLQENEFARR